MAKQEVKGLPGKTGLPAKGSLGSTGRAEDLFTDVHDDKSKDILHQVKGSIPGFGEESVYHFDMADLNLDPWPQRKQFRAMIDEWLAANVNEGEGMSLRRQRLSLLLGLSPNSLKQYYSGRQVPGRNLINRIIDVLGCSPSDLMDSPSAPTQGISPEEWRDSGQESRAFANALFHEVKDMCPGQRQAILDMVRAGKALAKYGNINKSK